MCRYSLLTIKSYLVLWTFSAITSKILATQEWGSLPDTSLVKNQVKSSQAWREMQQILVFAYLLESVIKRLTLVFSFLINWCKYSPPFTWEWGISLFLSGTSLMCAFLYTSRGAKFWWGTCYCFLLTSKHLSQAYGFVSLIL